MIFKIKALLSNLSKSERAVAEIVLQILSSLSILVLRG